MILNQLRARQRVVEECETDAVETRGGKLRKLKPLRRRLLYLGSMVIYFRFDNSLGISPWLDGLDRVDDGHKTQKFALLRRSKIQFERLGDNLVFAAFNRHWLFGQFPIDGRCIRCIYANAQIYSSCSWPRVSTICG